MVPYQDSGFGFGKPPLSLYPGFQRWVVWVGQPSLLEWTVNDNSSVVVVFKEEEEKEEEEKEKEEEDKKEEEEEGVPLQLDD